MRRQRVAASGTLILQYGQSFVEGRVQPAAGGGND